MSYQFLQGLNGMYVLQYDAIVQPEDNSITKCLPEAGTPGTLQPGPMNIYASLPGTVTGRRLLGVKADPSGAQTAGLRNSISLEAVREKITLKQVSETFIRASGTPLHTVFQFS